jgi:hypothetical protein
MSVLAAPDPGRNEHVMSSAVLRSAFALATEWHGTPSHFAGQSVRPESRYWSLATVDVSGA